MTKDCYDFMIFCMCLFPLGIWKLIEIIIWIVKHVKIDINF